MNLVCSYRNWFLTNKYRIFVCIGAIEQLVLNHGIAPKDAITNIALSEDLIEENLSAAWLQYVSEKDGEQK